jgi:methionyl-tRNA formyltransferase
MSQDVYVVATQRPWQHTAFDRHAPTLPGSWIRIDAPEDLTPDRLAVLAPRYVFFPHWSARIPATIHENWTCILFHMTDLPYGRGGSPLQNLIQAGHDSTVMSAIRVVEALDEGPVYLKRPLSLDGSAQAIFERAAALTWAMIEEIVATEPEPQAQQGAPTIFHRRRPEQSRLPDAGDGQTLYDHIRMLDAEGYPAAFLDHGTFRLTFGDASLDGDTVTARVTIRRRTPRHGETRPEPPNDDKGGSRQ